MVGGGHEAEGEDHASESEGQLLQIARGKMPGGALGFKEAGELVECALGGGADMGQVLACFFVLAEAEAGQITIVVEEVEHVGDNLGQIGR